MSDFKIGDHVRMRWDHAFQREVVDTLGTSGSHCPKISVEVNGGMDLCWLPASWFERVPESVAEEGLAAYRPDADFMRSVLLPFREPDGRILAHLQANGLDVFFRRKIKDALLPPPGKPEERCAYKYHDGPCGISASAHGTFLHARNHAFVSAAKPEVPVEVVLDFEFWSGDCDGRNEMKEWLAERGYAARSEKP